MKVFFLTTKWNGFSFEPCVDEAEMVRCDIHTKENIVFEGVPAEQVFSTREEAQEALENKN